MTLKEYKESIGLSYLQLAALFEVTGPTVYNWAKGKCKPHKKNSDKIFRVTGGKVDFN